MSARKPRPAPASAPTVESFERALKRLEEVVRRLDAEEVSLEESIHLYEEGMDLYRSCRGMLDEAEMKVRRLGAALEEAEGDE